MQGSIQAASAMPLLLCVATAASAADISEACTAKLASLGKSSTDFAGCSTACWNETAAATAVDPQT